jgi:hypothetical protein
LVVEVPESRIQVIGARSGRTYSKSRASSGTEHSNIAGTESESALSNNITRNDGQEYNVSQAVRKRTSLSAQFSKLNVAWHNRAVNKSSEPVPTISSVELQADANRQRREVSLPMPGAYPMDDEGTDEDCGCESKRSPYIDGDSTSQSRSTSVMKSEFTFSMPFESVQSRQTRNRFRVC